MSKQIHDESKRESSRKKQIRFRAEETLVETFDNWVEGSDYGSRSEALRAAMRQTAGEGDPQRAPLVPPAEEPLRTAYIKLCDVANADGVVRHDIAEEELATTLGKRKQTVNHMVLGKLRSRGYLHRSANVYGDRSWSLTGWDA
jgi:Arc/MetJ-type ribon-helix-helix transcriptional regulator